MPDNSALIKSLEDEIKRPLPTPKVATPVIWYPGNKKESPVAAIVGAVEAPGKVALIVFGLNSHPKTVKGVHHTTWPQHQQPGNVNTTMYGSWDYPEGRSPQKDLDFHKEQIQKRLDKAKAEHTPTPSLEPAGSK